MNTASNVTQGIPLAMWVTQIASRLNFFDLSKFMAASKFFNNIGTQALKNRLNYDIAESQYNGEKLNEPKYSGVLGIAVRYGKMIDHIRVSMPQFHAEGEKFLVLPARPLSQRAYLSSRDRSILEDNRLRIDTLVASSILKSSDMRVDFVKSVAQLGCYGVAMSIAKSTILPESLYLEVLIAMVERNEPLAALIYTYKSRNKWMALYNVIHALWERNRVDDAIELAKTFVLYPFGERDEGIYPGLTPLSYVCCRLVDLGEIDQAKEWIIFMLSAAGDKLNSKDRSTVRLIIETQMQIVARLAQLERMTDAKAYFESIDVSKVSIYEANYSPDHDISELLIAKPLDVFLSGLDEDEKAEYSDRFDPKNVSPISSSIDLIQDHCTWHNAMILDMPIHP